MTRLVEARRTAQQVALRAHIILLAAEGLTTVAVGRLAGVSREAVRLWRDRWVGLQAVPLAELGVAARLADAPRPGPHRGRAGLRDHRPGLRSPRAVGPPDQPVDGPGDRPGSDPARDRGDHFHPACRPAAQKGDLRPHLIRYWLTSAQEADFDAKVADLCRHYQEAPALVERGERVLSTDELTGAQALERAHPGLPLVPGKVERREFESSRHGTTSFLITRDVVSGQVVAPSCGPTRTALDFLTHVQQVIATDPAATRWHFAADHLNIHLSTPLVRYVAALSGVPEDLGEPGKRGILRTRHTRAAFLADPSHRIVFQYTPVGGSRLNMAEPRPSQCKVST